MARTVIMDRDVSTVEEFIETLRVFTPTSKALSNGSTEALLDGPYNLKLVEYALSDGSKVYDIQIRDI